MFETYMTPVVVIGAYGGSVDAAYGLALLKRLQQSGYWSRR